MLQVLTYDRNNYDPRDLIMARAGPLSFLILRDAEHIKRIMRAVRQMTTTEFHVNLQGRVLGTPQQCLKFYTSDGSKESNTVDYVHFKLIRQHLSGPPLMSLVDVYKSVIVRNLNQMDCNYDTWTEIPDLWEFFKVQITKSTIETLFGLSLLEEYPQIVNDFWEFDSNLENYTRGLPRFLLPSAYATRDRCLNGIKSWLRKNDATSQPEMKTGEEEVWDRQFGSNFGRQRDEFFVNENMDLDTRASEVLGIMLG